MAEEHTTAVVQRYPDELGSDSLAEPVIRALLDRATGRLRLLCTYLLYRSDPRLTRPPQNLRADEFPEGVVERLLKALRAIRPQTVRQFLALANQRTCHCDRAPRISRPSIRERRIGANGRPKGASRRTAHFRATAPGNTDDSSQALL